MPERLARLIPQRKGRHTKTEGAAGNVVQHLGGEGDTEAAAVQHGHAVYLCRAGTLKRRPAKTGDDEHHCDGGELPHQEEDTSTKERRAH